MQTITVYDPPMCCSTGVCGPEVDPKLVQFAGDLDWLKSRGVAVERINLAQEPDRFVANAAVKDILDQSGGDELPVIVVGDALVASGRYPGRDELAAWLGVNLAPRSAPLTEGAQESDALASRKSGTDKRQPASGSCGGGNSAGQETTSKRCC